MTDLRLSEFVKEHLNDDVQRLLLSSSRYPDVDVRLAVDLIIAKKKISKKIPSWENIDNLYFPVNISLEQASSEITANYKRRFVNGCVVADLTGGLGVDSYFLSQSAVHLFYFERNAELCEAARNNFAILGAGNISVINMEISENDISDIIPMLPDTGLIYLDPARRDNNKKRVYAIEDYQPNILKLKDLLFKITSKILIKISPMADICATLRQIQEISEVHVVSVNNECKELLFLLEKNHDKTPSAEEDVKVFTVNSCKGGKMETFDFNFKEESDSTSKYSEDKLFTYLYEPNSSILKAGAFKSLGEHYGIYKLNINTHLYTSESIIEDFPGRVFKIMEVFDFKKETFKSLRKKYPKANISTRNFPVSPDELKKMLKISDGGDFYFFGCTLLSGIRKILVCLKVV